MTMRMVMRFVLATAACVVVSGCLDQATDEALYAMGPAPADSSADAADVETEQALLRPANVHAPVHIPSTDNDACPAPPPNFGMPCDVGSGQGACAQGGTVDCDGLCRPADVGVGDPTEWHIRPAANGSWDWDCDGVIAMTLVPTEPPPACSTYADTQSCNGAATVEYVTESFPCGEQATLFKRDCDWKSFGPTCLDTPKAHRVVFQQCR